MEPLDCGAQAVIEVALTAPSSPMVYCLECFHRTSTPALPLRRENAINSKHNAEIGRIQSSLAAPSIPLVFRKHLILCGFAPTTGANAVCHGRSGLGRRTPPSSPACPEGRGPRCLGNDALGPGKGGQGIVSSRVGAPAEDGVIEAFNARFGRDVRTGTSSSPLQAKVLRGIAVPVAWQALGSSAGPARSGAT